MDQKNILFSLNVELQRKVIGQFSNIQSNLQDLTTEVTEVANASGKECADKSGAIRGEEIHLGRNIWIKKTCYDAIAGRSRMTPSLFVKEIAITVFGIEALRASTVTGGLSNRIKNKFPNAKPPSKLDPIKIMAIRDITSFWIKNILKKDANFAEMEKLKVTNYISHKISELKKKDKKLQNIIGSEDNEKNGVLENNLDPELSDEDLEDDMQLVDHITDHPEGKDHLESLDLNNDDEDMESLHSDSV
ncbi:uncharacterized protein LOC122511036 isoform X2 [Leptopilina heterotoma]|uniref:uncharacterized protein LOC122511036 isoform X2 n=1 Tax=Leptopilina heterotoma TaxID=63436 RepID=UPI001CA98E26|nr:uncharacterized protein LOC122511036 isoform X2 [Leptopilina heterotoma]